MKIRSIHVQDFRKFKDLTVDDIPESARLVVLVGPNGSGKTALFDVFSSWASWAKATGFQFQRDYHPKAGSQGGAWDPLDVVKWVEFHDYEISMVPPDERYKTAFYFRSAYRNETDFSATTITSPGAAEDDAKHPPLMISGDARVSDNYQRIVSFAISEAFPQGGAGATKATPAQTILQEAREALQGVFDDLRLEGVGDPLGEGTFWFSKSDGPPFKYKNLSAGERVAFDLLLDFVVKRRYFKDTVYCVDAPELHLHSAVQGSLLEECYRLLPEKCQLWVATQSIGTVRKAKELAERDPGTVVFLDFAGHDFDSPVVLGPATPNRAFWKKVFEVALGDLAGLVAPEHVVVCEGSTSDTGARRAAGFDADCLSRIFATTRPEVEFVPVGGVKDVERNSAELRKLWAGVLPRTVISGLRDGDDCNKDEIQEHGKRGTRVLSRRDLESYLWDDEILQKLCETFERDDATARILAASRSLRDERQRNGQPANDYKSITGQLYKVIRRTLKLTGKGDTPEAFAKSELAALVTPDTNVYKALEADIFGPDP
jgi:hypothetical protein